MLKADDEYRETCAYRLFGQGRKLLLKSSPILSTQLNLINAVLYNAFIGTQIRRMTLNRIN